MSVAEGRPLARSTFYRLLGHPFYAGLFRFNGEVYQGCHEPMLSPEEQQQIQRILKREGRPRPSRHEWAFTGLIRCGACGNLITAAWQKGRTGKKYPYYHCPRRNGCGQPYVLQATIEDQIARWLDRLNFPEEVLAWYLEVLEDLSQERRKTRQAMSVSRKQTKRSLERQLQTLTDLRVRNVIRDEDYLEQREKLLGQLASLDRPVEAQNVFEPSRAVIITLNNAKKRFLSSGTQKKRMIVEAVCSNPRLLDGKLLIQAQKPFALAGEGVRNLINLRTLNEIRTFFSENPNAEF